MAKETQKYTSRKIIITPFGIDCKNFKPLETEKKSFIIGTVKSVEKVYGIDWLIKSFKIIKRRLPNLNLKLLIVGSGTMEEFFRNKIKAEGLEDIAELTGFISADKVKFYHNMIDVFVALSISESFGVSVLEASACEKPVVVSDVGGLPEVVENGVTGFVVPSQNPEAAADAIEKLILDKKLRLCMGKAGRQRVLKKFDWNLSVDQMLDIYKKLLTHND
jgi:glycosyltransferase involved in cell wall biosynthesis